MKKLILLLAVLFICAAFSGCTVFETDTEALMHPPVFSEEQEKLNAALTEVTGGSYILKYPTGGEINSAFVFEDLDGDGIEEALAFYSLLDESTRINVLKKEGEGWKSVYEAAGFYGDIEYINFTEIDKNVKVLMVKWEEEAAVYRYENEKLKTLHRASCNGISIADIDGNSYSELVVFESDLSGRNTVNVVYSDGENILVSENTMAHAEYGKIYSEKTGFFYEGQYAYFIDSEVSDGIYLTEILTFENGELDRSFVADYVEYEQENESDSEHSGSGAIVIIGGNYGKRGIFLRNTAVYCMDTNGDGIIEMPMEIREDYAQSKSEEIFFLNFMQCDGVDSVPVWNGVANTKKGYLFALPESWNSYVEVSISSSGEELVITEKESGEEILKIFAVLKSDYQDKYEDYILGAEDGNYNYYVEARTEEGESFVTAPEIIVESFIFI